MIEMSDNIMICSFVLPMIDNCCWMILQIIYTKNFRTQKTSQLTFSHQGFQPARDTCGRATRTSSSISKASSRVTPPPSAAASRLPAQRSRSCLAAFSSCLKYAKFMDLFNKHIEKDQTVKSAVCFYSTWNSQGFHRVFIYLRWCLYG